MIGEVTREYEMFAWSMHDAEFSIASHIRTDYIREIWQIVAENGTSHVVVQAQ